MSAIDRISADGNNGRWVERVERMRTAQLAHHLSSLALRQGERAMTGVVALPGATALGIAATAMYTVAVVERAFEVVESAIGEIGKSIGGPDELPRGRPADRPEARA